MIDANIFMEIMNNHHFNDLKKISHIYGKEALDDTIKLLKEMVYKSIKVKDFTGKNLVYNSFITDINDDAYKFLLSNKLEKSYSICKMEDEIHSTLAIESIYSSRYSIKNILQGKAPITDDEDKIYGIKKGLDFISDKRNKITEENIYKLYMLSIGDYLSLDNEILKGNYYRHDNVYVVGSDIHHEGLKYDLLDEYMSNFVKFINEDSDVNTIIKSAIIHFYFAYLHPYFDGNGRMARLLHLWYLIQNNFNATLMVSFSELISVTKNLYYKSFEIIEKNYEISKVIDVTPFIMYFNKNIFSKLKFQNPQNNNILEKFDEYIVLGKITPKEKDLFMFIMSYYGTSEFSTKQLEKDYKNAAYATIRSFVLKLSEFELLVSVKYSNRLKYRLNTYNL